MGTIQNDRSRKCTPLRVLICAGVLTTGACADGVGGPTSPSANPRGSGLAALPLGDEGASGQTGTSSVSSAAVRSGDFYLKKECSEFASLFCTVTSSNVKAIEAGSRIIYAQGPANGVLDTDITIDPPGPGNNKAFGHCVLVVATGTGRCTLTGGTGEFTHFTADANVSYTSGVDWVWQGGTFSFRPND